MQLATEQHLSWLFRRQIVVNGARLLPPMPLYFFQLDIIIIIYLMWWFLFGQFFGGSKIDKSKAATTFVLCRFERGWCFESDAKCEQSGLIKFWFYLIMISSTLHKSVNDDGAQFLCWSSEICTICAFLRPIAPKIDSNKMMMKDWADAVSFMYIFRAFVPQFFWL